MSPSDIPLATAVEKAAYARPAPLKNLADELLHNRLAHYLSLTHPAGTLLGMAGYWLIAAEAHVITIAIVPRWQRLGLGQWLLLALINDACWRQAETVTLEVRPSNQAALALYRQMGFKQVGQRPNYYDHPPEDALIFTSPPLASSAYQVQMTRRKTELTRQLARIEIDKIGQKD